MLESPSGKKNAYFTSGQFWVGLLFAIGLALMCMPFSAPVVFPLLGLAAILSTSIGTIALEACVAFLGGFALSQILWKFGDYFNLATNLQKLGQWMEKWIKRLVYLATAVVTEVVTLLLAVGQVGGRKIFKIGVTLIKDNPFYIGLILGLVLAPLGFFIMVANILLVLAITIPLGLAALILTGVGLALETLGWIFAVIPLREISNIKTDSFIVNVAKWVLYLIAFPFFQLEKLGKFIAETAFTIFMSVYSDVASFGFAMLNKEKDNIYPLPFLKKADLFDYVEWGWKALAPSASTHAPVPLAELPNAASVACTDTHWVAKEIEKLVKWPTASMSRSASSG